MTHLLGCMNESAEVKPVLPMLKVIIWFQEIFLIKLSKVENKSGESERELFADEEHKVIVDYKICI